jgi:hypothetical protein
MFNSIQEAIRQLAAGMRRRDKEGTMAKAVQESRLFLLKLCSYQSFPIPLPGF